MRVPRPTLTVPVVVYLLVATAAAALAVSIGVLLHRQSTASADSARVLVELREQNDAIRDLLKRQDRNDASRQQLIDEAVAEIAAEQYRALVAHDHRVAEMLRRNARLLEREVNHPSNREDRALTPIPAPRAVAPTPAPAPMPRVAPKPSPCEKAGKSGRCKR